MYTESDIEAAVAGGALTNDAALAFRTFVAGQRTTPAADEENFKLLTGFNDIFVAIAGALLLIGVGYLGASVAPVAGSAAVALSAWGLAEYFTRQRRMALPSILFLLAFAAGVFGVAAALFFAGRDFEDTDRNGLLLLALCAAITAGAAYGHWLRFKVPITVAAGTAALGLLVYSLITAAVPALRDTTLALILLLVLGLCAFGFAMWWDTKDPARITGRSDVAFWLHLLAAPLIVHPIFAMLGLLDGTPAIGEAVVVIALYIVMGLIAVAVDRRALLVSALAYVLYAIWSLFEQFGSVSTNFALAGVIIGSALLLLSAFWQSMRAIVLGVLPGSMRARLPNSGIIQT